MNLRRLTFMIGLVVVTTPAAAVDFLDPEHLNIYLKTDLVEGLGADLDAGAKPLTGLKKKMATRSKAVTGDDKDTWIEACEGLGTYLRMNQGIWGHGVFLSFSCYWLGEPIGGLKGKRTSPYRIVYDSTHKNHVIELQFKREHKVWVKLSTITLPPSDRTLAIVSEDEIASLIALAFTYDLPMARFVDIKKDLVNYRDKIRRGIPLPRAPEEYTVVRTQQVGDVTETDPVGSLILNKRKGRKTPAWNLVLSNKTWEQATYWAYDKNGAAKQKQVERTLSKAFAFHNSGMKEKMLESFNYGHLGFRYGLSFLSHYPLTRKAQMFSVFTESRGGTLEGLRWYWDMAPNVTDNDEGNSLYMFWSRESVGWSFGWDLDFLGLDRIDVTPKMGVMDFLGRLPITTAAGEKQSIDFTLKGAYSMGAELGIEAMTEWTLLRLWGASDFAGFTTATGRVASSMRGGLDTYWSFGEFSEGVNLALIAFAVGEKVGLSAKNLKGAPDEPLVARQVTLQFGFAGLGLALTW